MSLDTAGTELSPLILTPLTLGPLGLTADASFEDLVDSPNWDTYPVSGQSTNWSLIKGVYTLEGSTSPNQAIVYRKMDLLDVAINATVLNAFTQNTQSDNFLSCRISDADNYIGCRCNQNGFIVSDVVAGVPTNLATLVVTTPFSVRIVAQGDKLRVYYNGSLAADLTTSIVVPGQVGIIARANTSAVPLSVFRNYRPIAVYPIISNVVINPGFGSADVSCETDVACVAELFIDDFSYGTTVAGTAHAWSAEALDEWTTYNYRIEATSAFGVAANPVSGTFQTEGSIPTILNVDVAYGDPATNVTITCDTDEPCDATLRVEGVSQGTTPTDTSHSWATSGWQFDTTYNFTIDAINPATGQSADQYQGSFTPTSITAAYKLNIFNPQVTDSRAAGTCYAWDGSQYKAFSDPTAPITIGVPAAGAPDTPVDTIEDLTFYPLYPKWRTGEAVFTGEIRSLNRRAQGDTVLVTFNKNLICPKEWEADPADFSVGENYVRQLGLYCEPTTSQILDGPTDLTHASWTTSGTVTVTPNAGAGLIEGFQMQRVQSADASATIGQVLQGFVGTLDRYVGLLAVFRIDQYAGVGSSVKFRLAVPDSDTFTIAFNQDGTIVEEYAGNQNATNCDYEIEFRPGGWVELYMRCKNTVGGGTSTFTFLPAVNADGSTADIKITAFCVADLVHKYQPIPYTGARPGNQEQVLGTSQEMWHDRGCNDAFTMLLGTDDTVYDNSTARQTIFFSLTSANVLYTQNTSNLRPTVNFPGSIIGTGFTDSDDDRKRSWTSRVEGNIGTGSLTLRSWLTQHQLRSTAGSAYTGTPATGDARHNADKAMVGAIRYFAYWNRDDIITDERFDELFGP